MKDIKILLSNKSEQQIRIIDLRNELEDFLSDVILNDD